MIIPAIFEETFEKVQEKVSLVDQFTRLVQIDVADGVFVDGRTFQEIGKLDEIKTSVHFELHLMVINPLRYLMDLPKKSAIKISAHVETKDFVNDFINVAKNLIYQTGLSINPETPIEALDPYLEKLDFVQFMTVKPGGQGRTFDHSVLQKIKSFKESHPDKTIQVDGGIDSETLKSVLETGVDDVVIGSNLFNQLDIRQAFINFKGI